MGVVRCHYCHKLIAEENWEAHLAVHLALKPDGQQTDYSSLPEEQRYQGSLEGVPMWYTHSVCGVTTGMPEFIIRTYLVEPDFYADNTFCHGCNTHVPHQECYWKETNEPLPQYFDRLQYQVAMMKQSWQISNEMRSGNLGQQYVGHAQEKPVDIIAIIKKFFRDLVYTPPKR